YASARELRARPAALAPQQRLQSREHLLDVKGLGDVVVRARLQPLDLVLPVVARREYQDRESLARGPQAADHLAAWQIREPGVDDGHVERKFVSGNQRLVAG